MARILAIENDAKQGGLLKLLVRNHVGATLVVVRSKDEAIAAISEEAPDLILVSALLSPREEEDIVAHLRTLAHAAHLQTLTLPRFSSSSDDGSSGGLLGLFRRRASRSTGCDPRKFAEEIVGYLLRGAEIKAERAAIEEAAARARAERPSTDSTERLTARITESTDRLTTEITESTEDASAALAEITARQDTPVAALAAPPAAAEAAQPERVTMAPAPAGPPRPAPLAIWAKRIDATESAPASSEEPVIADDVRALLRSLRLPVFLAEIARVRGCRIRRVRIARPRPRGRRAQATA